MQDDELNTVLRDWSNARLPDNEKRNKMIRSVLERPRRRPYRRMITAALSAIVAVAATLLFLLTPPLENSSREPATVSPHTVADNIASENIQVSLIVLKQLPDSDSAVEFLEDTIFVTEGKKLHELELSGHRLFLWIYPLEKTLFSLDIGLDNTAETGVVAVPDRPQLLQFQSNGDRFDVLVSVI